VKPMWIVLFAVLAALFVALFGTGIYATLTDEDTDSPEVAARKAECRKLEHHLFGLYPESAGKTPEEVVPIEDIELCGAAYPEVIACMQAAPDLQRVHDCMPEPVKCKEDEKTTVVDGTRPIYEVVGKCDTVVIKTTNAFVVLKSGKRAEIAGDHNVVQIATDKDLPKPEVVDQGKGNRIQ
jgi:hypothetical protein